MLTGGRHRRRRSNVQIRGCGCCLPLALGLVGAPVVALGIALKGAR